MDYDKHFADSLRKLKTEGNYRVFADLERKAGAVPRAIRHIDGSSQDAVVWCSNDYLGMALGKAPGIEDLLSITGDHRTMGQCLWRIATPLC